jgi:predicted glycosyltransferase
VVIARRLRQNGHEVVVTIRKHPDTTPMANFLKEKVIAVGTYDPASLLTRVEEGAKRQLAFCKLFEKEQPQLAISHGSADQCRVAFGLGIPIISTVDTPYAEAVHRLTLPISSYIVASNAIPRKVLENYNINGELVRFDSVDEVAWIKNFKPKAKYDFGKPLIVVRQIEEKAVYTEKRPNLLAVAKRLTKLGKVVFLSRYDRKETKGLIVPKDFVDSASMVAQADLFVGVGGTITREAALQGVPAIVIKVFSAQFVNDLLIQKGFPIFKTSQSQVVDLARKLIGRKYEVKDKLAKLENPVDTIAGIVDGFSSS